MFMSARDASARRSLKLRQFQFPASFKRHRQRLQQQQQQQRQDQPEAHPRASSGPPLSPPVRAAARPAISMMARTSRPVLPQSMTTKPLSYVPVPVPTPSSPASGESRTPRSARKRQSRSPTPAATPQSASSFVYARSHEERAQNPERLNLDRKGLAVCPVFEGETELRLLNLENNLITRITPLTGLPNLIFLDLYNNRIERITGLDSVPSLRVLMLGKNNISKISGLDALNSLDVLDLHANRIEVIENIFHLRLLRVLNLAGNAITDVGNLSALRSLTELNLRRNSIADLNEMGVLPSLQRLFVSNNRLEDMSAISSVLSMHWISELSLDGNRLCAHLLYRPLVVHKLHSLQQLDLNSVSPSERASAARQLRSTEGRALLVVASRDNTAEPVMDPPQAEEAKPQVEKEETPKQEDDVERKPAAEYVPPPSAPQEETEDIYAESPHFEWDDDKTALRIWGPAFDPLTSDSQHERSRVRELEVSFVDIHELGLIMRYLLRCTNLRRLHLRRNNIRAFWQLNALVGLDLDELRVDENPICDIPLFRLYTIARLPTLTRLDGVLVSSVEAEEASRLFGKLKVLWETPELARQFLSIDAGSGAPVGKRKRVAQLKKVSNRVVAEAVHKAAINERRLKAFENVWMDILESYARRVVAGGE